MTARMDDTAGIVFTPPRGVKPKPPRFAGKHFLKPQSEGAPTTTRQAEVLNTAIIGSPGDNRGVVIGTDQLSGAMVAHDPFTAYEGHRITSPNVCLIGGLGSGKALDVDTLIPTPQGFVRIGDIEVGDYVFDETGNPTRVVAVSDVMTGRECLAVRFSDGSVIVADAQHLWKTVTRSNRNKRSPYGGPITTSRISETMMAGQQTNHAVALTRPLSLPDADLLIDPYTLGAWLGDGSSSSGTITTPDREVLANIEDAGYLTTFRGRYAHTITIPKDHGPHHAPAICAQCGDAFITSYIDQRACSRRCAGLLPNRHPAHPRCATCGVLLPKGSTGHACRACFGMSTFTGHLRAVGVLNNKHIPVQYLRASESQRRALLAGLLDSDGTVAGNGAIVLALCNKTLALHARELMCSLGYRASMSSKPAKLDGRTVGTSYIMSFTTSDDVFRLERKHLAHKDRSRNYSAARNCYRYIVAVEPVTSRPVRCIQVDAASSMYLAGETMIPTHNSSLLKSVYVMRPLTMRRRRAVVMDKKMRDGEGEYAEVTRQHNAEPFRFDPDDPRGSTCMNVLDPVILAGGGPAVQRQLLSAVAELAGDGPLDEWHNAALTYAYNATMAKFDGGRTPIIPDLIQQIPGVVDAPEYAGLRSATLDLIERAAWSLRFRLERLLADDLAGMFGGETSKHVTLHPKLTTFDISALPEDGPATSMVMVVANAWLMGMLTHDRGWRTSFIAEEGWHLLAGPGGKVIRSKSKLSRGLGLSIVAAIHHISDIPADSDAVAMIKEAQTIHLFRQEHDIDIQDCVKYFGLEASNAAVLGSLPQGDHLLKVGSQKEIRVRHVRTEREVQFTETDAAMLLPEPVKVTV